MSRALITLVGSGVEQTTRLPKFNSSIKFGCSGNPLKKGSTCWCCETDEENKQNFEMYLLHFKSLSEFKIKESDHKGYYYLPRLEIVPINC